MRPTLIVFSHLRWDFVYQRPQHLMTRLAARFPVYFIEEPVIAEGSDHLELSSPAPGVTVCRPRTTVPASGFHDAHIPRLRTLLRRLTEEQRLDDYVLWFYSPMALPFAQELSPRAVVYDCMDELSAFLNAPKQLVQRENALLKLADLVFTGGPSLYRAKRTRHSSVHCFPSSVDREHFAIARTRGLDHPDQRRLRRPRLGYFGVIDERIDLHLIADMAASRPKWDIALVGPVAKIDHGLLPKHANIHYFGQRPYEELPRFVAGWDVCLLPFALNGATRYISPTKTLEYMAAERPIVSTAIADVIEPYGDIVRKADAAAFVQQCDLALTEPERTWARRVEKMRAAVRATSWERTADGMSALLEKTLSKSQPRPLHIPVENVPSRPLDRKGPILVKRRVEAFDTIVIGAGPTGMSAAYHLGDGALLLEKNARVGGWCRSIVENGYTFDHAGHIMFSNDRYVHELYGKLLGDNVHWQDREAWIYSKNVYTRYPFQGSLHGLPPDVLKECLVGAIEARFGPLSGAARSDALQQEGPKRGSSTCAGKPESITDIDCCADGTSPAVGAALHASARGIPPRREPANFEEFIYGVWGAGVAKHFAIPYNQKLWAVPLSEMETSWLGGRVPLPDLEEMIDGALRPSPKPVGPNARFGYPLRGGFQALMDGFLPLLECEVKLNAEVKAVNSARHEVTLRDGSVFRYRHLVSTVPLPALIRMMGAEPPDRVRAAAAALRHVSVRCVNLGIARPNLTDKHWVYYPEDTVFHRVFMQGNASPYCSPPDGFGLTCEITYSPSKPLPCDGDDLIDLCIADCIRVGLFGPEDRVAVRNQVDMPCAYVVYDHSRKRSVDEIRNWLGERDVLLAGRYGEWEYYNSDHAFIAGKKAAEALVGTSRRGASIDAVP